MFRVKSKLNLNANKSAGDAGTAWLMQGMQGGVHTFANLTRLDLSGNNISDVGITHVARHKFSKVLYLESLYCRYDGTLTFQNVWQGAAPTRCLGESAGTHSQKSVR